MLRCLMLLTVAATVLRQTSAQDLDLYPVALPQQLDETDFEEEEEIFLGEVPRRADALGPRDCAEIKDENFESESGLYTIFPNTCDGCFYTVYCDMDSEGGGWTVIFKRHNGSVDFYRGWNFYKMGFGDIENEFYLGHERVRQITILKPMELKICLTDVGNLDSVAGYSNFYLGNETSNYTLHIDSFYGDAGDYLSISNNTQFSTFDRDHDGSMQNCAEYFHSAWWYNTNTSSAHRTHGTGHGYSAAPSPTFAYRQPQRQRTAARRSKRTVSTPHQQQAHYVPTSGHVAHSGHPQPSIATCQPHSNLLGYYFLGRKELPHFAGPGISWRPVPGPGGPAVKQVIWKIRPMGYIGGSRSGQLRRNRRHSSTEADILN